MLPADEQRVLETYQAAKNAAYWEGYALALVHVSGILSWFTMRPKQKVSYLKSMVLAEFKKAASRIPNEDVTIKKTIEFYENQK